MDKSLILILFSLLVYIFIKISITGIITFIIILLSAFLIFIFFYLKIYKYFNNPLRPFQIKGKVFVKPVIFEPLTSIDIDSFDEETVSKLLPVKFRTIDLNQADYTLQMVLQKTTGQIEKRTLYTVQYLPFYQTACLVKLFDIKKNEMKLYHVVRPETLEEASPGKHYPFNFYRLKDYLLTLIDMNDLFDFPNEELINKTKEIQIPETKSFSLSDIDSDTRESLVKLNKSDAIALLRNKYEISVKEARRILEQLETGKTKE